VSWVPVLGWLFAIATSIRSLILFYQGAQAILKIHLPPKKASEVAKSEPQGRELVNV
jgi:hypothetical protein